MTSESEESIIRPLPTNLDDFLPWACGQSGVETAIVIIRSELGTYSPIKKGYKGKGGKGDISGGGAATATTKESPPLVMGITEGKKNVVNIETVYDTNGRLVQLKFHKNLTVPRTIFKILSLITSFHPQLTRICINRGVTSGSVYELSKIVSQTKISEIILDDTVIPEANYYLLIEENNSLKYLSLARCKLNDAAVEALASRLIKAPLCILNLSSNRITDVGAGHIGQVLRFNRKLSYLNLSGNMITDVGAASILNCLTEFPLTNKEIIEKKTRLIAYYKEKNLFAMKNLDELRSTDKRSIKKPIKVAASTSKKQKGLERAISVKSLIPTANLDSMWIDRATKVKASNLDPFQDPYSNENTIIKDGVLYCLGNNALCYLSLAYNDLTYFSVKKLYEVVNTQDDLRRVPKGLVNVCIEGNNIPETCEELTEIDYILQSTLATTKRESMRRRPVKVNLK